MKKMFKDVFSFLLYLAFSSCASASSSAKVSFVLEWEHAERLPRQLALSAIIMDT